jgi:hypothetical protein
LLQTFKSAPKEKIPGIFAKLPGILPGFCTRYFYPRIGVLMELKNLYNVKNLV